MYSRAFPEFFQNYRLMPIARCPLYYKFACAKFETWAILARETVLHFMRHFSRCIPLGSWRIKGIEPYRTKWGDFALPKTPSTNPMRFGCTQAFRRLTTNKRACLPLCNPSLYPRDQPSAVWIPPFHGDHKGASPPLWTPPTKGLFVSL